MNGQTVVGQTNTIFDTGTTQIIGDVVGIQSLFLAIGNAEPLPQSNGIILYTSMFSSAVDQPLHDLPTLSQSLATSTLPFMSMLGEWKSRFLLPCLILALSPRALIGVSLVRLRIRYWKRKAVSCPRDTFPWGTKANHSHRILDSWGCFPPQCLLRLGCWQYTNWLCCPCLRSR